MLPGLWVVCWFLVQRVWIKTLLTVLGYGFTIYSVAVFQYFVANGKEVLVLYQCRIVEVWVSVFLVIELYELTVYLLVVGSIICKLKSVINVI